MRIFACPPSAGGYTKTVSLKLISRASRCRLVSGISRASVNTASWLPLSGSSVNTSTTT
jgi:hypothetical protein